MLSRLVRMPLKQVEVLRTIFAKMVRGARGLAAYHWNDAYYWDRYVRRWDQTTDTSSIRIVGEEWGSGRAFAKLVTERASVAYVGLEIGCGAGRVTQYVAPSFTSLVCCDISSEMLATAEETVRGQNVSFIKINGFDLDCLQDNTFDMVFSHDVFVHFPLEAVFTYYEEISRVLRPGGICLISHFSLAIPMNLQAFVKKSRLYQTQHTTPPHQREYYTSPESLKIFIESAGLEFFETILISEDTAQQQHLAVVARKA